VEGGTVSIQVARDETGTRVSVRNTAGDGEFFETAKMYRPGHALENVRARLRLFTGRTEPLQVLQDPAWTEFSFRI
jgi:LytS/YehU family sensor histidine kinase